MAAMLATPVVHLTGYPVRVRAPDAAGNRRARLPHGLGTHRSPPRSPYAQVEADSRAEPEDPERQRLPSRRDVRQP